MDDLPRINMIKLSVDLFKFVGEAKRNTSRKLLCFRVFTASTMLISLYFIFVNLFFVKGAMYVQALQSLVLFTHLFLKYVSLLNYKRNIETLLANVARRFWSHRNYDRNVERAIERIYAIIERVQRVMVTVSLFCLFAYFMKPLSAANKGLLIESLIPRSDIMGAVVIVSQFYCFYVGFPIILGYDFIYFALCVHLILQLRLLKFEMQKILDGQGENTKSEIIKCIRHHQFLFTMFLQMKGIYSAMLLFHYFVTLVTTCSFLLELFLRRSNIMNYFAKVFSIFVFVGQFALYAFPADQITSEVGCRLGIDASPTMILVYRSSRRYLLIALV
ncbi:hypothetical protein Trydic_g17487 [Trypoxylus dichotomus]